MIIKQNADKYGKMELKTRYKKKSLNVTNM